MSTPSSINLNSSIIQHALNAKTTALDNKSIEVQPLEPKLSDLVEISKIAIEKQQAPQLDATNQIKEIALDVIKVSSTIGKARTSNNLTNSQATELYKKIAQLL